MQVAHHKVRQGNVGQHGQRNKVFHRCTDRSPYDKGSDNRQPEKRLWKSDEHAGRAPRCERGDVGQCEQRRGGRRVAVKVELRARCLLHK